MKEKVISFHNRGMVISLVVGFLSAIYYILVFFGYARDPFDVDEIFIIFIPLIIFCLCAGIVIEITNYRIKKLKKILAVETVSDSGHVELPEWILTYYPHDSAKYIENVFARELYSTQSNGVESSLYEVYYILKDGKGKAPALTGLAVIGLKHGINELLDLPAVGRLHGSKVELPAVDLDGQALLIKSEHFNYPQVPITFISNNRKLKKLTVYQQQVEPVEYFGEVIGYLCFETENSSDVLCVKNLILNNIDLFKSKHFTIACFKEDSIYYSISLSAFKTSKAKRTFVLDEQKLNSLLYDEQDYLQRVNDITQKLSSWRS